MQRIVLLDLDKTVIDADYQLTTDPKPIIRKCAEKGIRIGLCSDSSLPSLQRWASRLEISGPVIAERGAVAWDPVSDKETIIHPRETDFFSDLTREFVRRVVLLPEPPAVFFGDAPELLRTGIEAIPPEPHMLLVNKYRRFSFSFFARRFDQKKEAFVVDGESLNSFAALTKAIAEACTVGNLDWDINPEYGIVILHAACTQKHFAVNALLKTLGTTDRVSMVGDSIADFLANPRVMQYAVANASEEYRLRSAFVSGRPFTGGVCDILSRIAQGELG